MNKDTFRFLFFATVYTFALFGVAVALTGCMSVKELECLARDNTSRPCN